MTSDITTKWMFLIFGLLITAAPVLAQSERRSVSVVGYATKELTPDRYLISVRLSANGKTMTLAKAEFAKKLEKLKDVFNEMDFPNLHIESSGITLSNSDVQSMDDVRIMMMEGRGEPELSANVYMIENFKFQFEIGAGQTRSQIEEGLATFLDKAIEEKLDLGMPMNQVYYSGQDTPQLVRFKHSKAKEESKQLYKAAFENAKTQALELAELAGAKLGDVISIDASSPLEMLNRTYVDGMEQDSVEPTCRLGQKITLQAGVTVRFELD